MSAYYCDISIPCWFPLQKEFEKVFLRAGNCFEKLGDSCSDILRVFSNDYIN